MTGLVLVGVLLVIMGCSSPQGPSESGTATASASSPEPSPTPVRTSQSQIFERGCETKVGAVLSDRWQDDAAVEGPVSFYAASQYADPSKASDFDAKENQRYTATKLLVVLEGDSPVEVWVADESLPHVSLLYDVMENAVATEDNLYPLTAGHEAVRFMPCPHPRGEPTQYNGAFIVAGARCAHLNIRVADMAPSDFSIPFGVEACP